MTGHTTPPARCDDCGRPIWSPRARRPRLGRTLGGGCYRKALARRLTLTAGTTHPIPGQLDLLEDPCTP